jgi:uncharacterized protein (DUF2344 family)
MGIHSDGNIYGISWNIYDIDDNFIRKFEKIYSEKITLQQIEEIKEEYYKLNNFELINIKVKIFTKCSTSYQIDFNKNKREFMCWIPFSKISLAELFIFSETSF